MASIILYSNFNKKLNSTKQPEGGTQKSVALKEDTSLANPVFILSEYDSSWNYCNFKGRYYYIVDVVFASNHLYELHCATDLLATYKSEILKVDCNILYCDGSTKNIIDQRIPITSNIDISTATTQFKNIAFTQNGGAIIIGITGKGSFGSYVLQYSSNITSLLDGVDNYTDIFTDTLATLKQLFYGGSAAENLKAAIRIPLLFQPDAVSSGNAENLCLGNYPCKTDSGSNIKGYYISKPVMTDEVDITIPWKYSDWRKNQPYSEVVLYLPCIGVISIPSNVVLNDNAIRVKYSINITSGDISATYSGATTGRIIGTASGNIAENTPFGSTGVDTTKMTTAIVGGVGAIIAGTATIATGGAAVSAALKIGGGLAGAAGGTFSAMGGTGGGSGGLGGGSVTGLDTNIHCFVISRNLADTQEKFNPIMGKPFMSVDKISNHKGFVMTEGFQINIAGLGNDKSQINSFMDSGVYIE